MSDQDVRPTEGSANDHVRPAAGGPAEPEHPRGREPDLAMSRYVARLMDMSLKVPGTGFHVGLDAVIGLVPYVGDVVTGAAGGVILIDAARHKVPPELMGKMIVNLGADVIGGAAIPVAGDLFDLVWKANKKNLTLLEDHLGLPRTFGKQQAAAESRWRLGAGDGMSGGFPPVGGQAGASAAAGDSSFGIHAQRAPGEARIDIVESRAASRPAQLIRATFVADRIGRRSETRVWGSGGGGMIYGSGGNLSGYTNPVNINSRTTDDNEIWFRAPNGAETQVTLDADRVRVREGQNVSLVFVRDPKGNIDTLVSITNHTTRDTQVLVDLKDRPTTFWKIVGGTFPVGKVSTQLLGLAAMVLAALWLFSGPGNGGPSGTTLTILGIGAALGIAVVFRTATRIGTMSRNVLEEARSFGQDGASV